MWSKTLLLSLRVRVQKGGHGFRLFLPLALYPLSGLLLAWDCIFALIPGALGEKMRGLLETAHAVVYALLESRPQEFVHVDVQNQEEAVLVDLRTLGFLEGGEQE